MRKKILISFVIASLFVACVHKEEQKVPDTVVVAQPEEIIEPVEVKEEPKEEVKKKSKKISYTYYRVIPKQIETFPYFKLSNNAVIDDSKLKNSFYLNGDLLRIEKIFDSKSGVKYGKIVGKALIVSMDDLTKK